MFQRLGSHGGGTLRIAAGADLELPTIVVQGLARYHLLAAPARAGRDCGTSQPKPPLARHSTGRSSSISGPVRSTCRALTWW